MKIFCPHCKYDGSDLKIGRNLPYFVKYCDKPRMVYSKCKVLFVVKTITAKDIENFEKIIEEAKKQIKENKKILGEK